MKMSSIAILCGGRGTRLKHHTDSIPKALVKVQGKAILDYILLQYIEKGYDDFIICIGCKGEQIKTHCNEKYKGICNITFSDAGENASMLERVYMLKDSFDDAILVSYGDTLTDLDINSMKLFHKEKRAGITITTAKITSPFGIVTFDDECWATSYIEKPTFNYYIGHFILEKEIISLMTKDLLSLSDGHGLIGLFNKLIKIKALAVYEHTGLQVTFNTEEERSKAEKDILKFYTFNEK
jgi:NDP-sugar pyrophosphorylase family protein